MALAVRGVCAFAVRILGIPTAMQTAPYLEADPEFQIVGQSRNRTHSQPKGNLSERYEFRRVDNSIWRQLQEVLRTIQDVREYLTRPLASSDRSRCC
jgi:signal transduction protein with GAF and PtsI domain